jgi:hypothetical protein
MRLKSFEAGIFEPPLSPFKADDFSVTGKAYLPMTPHFNRRVILPAVIRIVQRFKNLQALDALFS